MRSASVSIDATRRADTVRFENVSKFYGEVLGVNHVDLTIKPGITSLVGPNGSGKSTILNLMTGLLRPTRGTITVLGLTPSEPDSLFGRVGYCAQYDSFPRGLSGFAFLYHYVRLHGHSDDRAKTLALQALERVNLLDAAKRPVAAYSKGMRQRIKLAQAICHRPTALILDEPLNGLDPIARAEMIALFKELGEQELHVIISSHILHEVDMVSDRVILLDQGYVVAAGSIEGVRSEVTAHPMQIMVRCDQPGVLAGHALAQDHVMEVKMHEDRAGLHIRTRDPDRFYLLLNRIVLDGRISIESVGPADEDVDAVYRYVIMDEGEAM
jgi:ABC-2 type transport system ATP-binding protein